jgi:phosphoribosylformylglycinamidine synthase I
MAIRVLVLRTAGTNCDEETAHAWRLAGVEADRLHIGRVIESPAVLDRYAALTIPGGFSYGDDIAAGRILANQVIHHLVDALRAFIERGRLVLGICNGFQVLARSGLLPGQAGNAAPRQTVTLTTNDSARFEDRWVHLRAATDRCVFLPADARLYLPIAHGEGKLVPADPAERRRLHDERHVAVQYCDARGEPGPFPVNPNGSVDDIAGLTDPTGLVFGLMPHPERHVDRAQHPAPSARGAGAEPSGRIVFAAAVRYLRSR